MEKIEARKPVALLKTFRRLQESRVQTYQSFDAYLREYLSDLDKEKYVEGCKRVTAEFSRISQEIISIEEALRRNERTLHAADAIRKVQEFEREKLSKTVVCHAFLALHAGEDSNGAMNSESGIEAAQQEDYDDLSVRKAEIETLKKMISGQLEEIQEEVYEMEEDICFDDEDPVIVQDVVSALCSAFVATTAQFCSHDFSFYHYCCDRVHDRAWGPSGRCVQIAVSSLGGGNNSNSNSSDNNNSIPSIEDIHKALHKDIKCDAEKIRSYMCANYGVEGSVFEAGEDFSKRLCEHLSKNGIPAFISDRSGITLVIAAAVAATATEESLDGKALYVLVVDPRVCVNVSREELIRCGSQKPANGVSYNVNSTLFCGWSNLEKILAGKKWNVCLLEEKSGGEQK